MFCVIWQFRVKPHRLEEFVAHYSAKGSWAQLFARSSEYQGTELLRDALNPLVFVTIDRWKSQVAFNVFKNEFAADYRQLDRECESLTEQEQNIGCYHTDRE